MKTLISDASGPSRTLSFSSLIPAGSPRTRDTSTEKVGCDVD